MNWETIPVVSDLVRIIIEYSPRVLFALIALALGWVVGRVISFLLSSFIGKLGLETAFRKTSIGRAILRAGHTPSSFFGMLGKGVIYLLTILFALKLLSVPALTDLVQAILDYLPKLVEGSLIIIAGFVCTDWISEMIEKGTSTTIQPSLLSYLVRAVLYFMTITIALVHLNIDVTILYIFAQAFAWSLAIAIGVAFGWSLKDKARLWLETMLPQKEKEKDTV